MPFSNSNKPAFYALTMPVAGDRPLFEKVEAANTIITALQALRAGGSIFLYAFAVMPDHLKLLVAPKGGSTVRDMLYSLRRNIGQALSGKGLKGTVWTPKSEIQKVFESVDARALARTIEGAAVDAGMVEDPRAYLFASAHPDHQVDALPETAPATVAHPLAVPATA